MPYPDTTLGADVLDDEYGGRPASEFGGLAWRWINAVVRFLSAAFLAYQRVSYTTIVATTQTAALAGDVAVFVPASPMVNSGYDVRKYEVDLGGAIVVGIYLAGTASLAQARVITSGLIPAAVSGLPPLDAAAPAGIDTASGRLRVAQAGDAIVGMIDVQGNVLLTGYGSAAP